MKDRSFYKCPDCRGKIITELDEKKDIIAICDNCGKGYDIAYLDGWHDHEILIRGSSK